jgi:hypothetical protein
VSKRIALLVALATTTACGPNLAQEPAESFQARVDAAVAVADTTGLATLAEARCQSLGNEERRLCYEDYFLSLADSQRVRLALGALAHLGQAQREIEGDGHGYTHVIGIRAWKPGDDVGEVFRSCTSLFQSGCYHGVIQSYLTATGEVDSARTAEMCDEIAPYGTDNFLRFQCLHGIGHGLEMAWNWDLPRALGGCDWLTSEWDRRSCYGGAIMENAVASSPGGHHTAARALENTGDDHGAASAAAHDHAAGDGEMAMSAMPFKMRDSTDALYPCSVLDERYTPSCFLGHGGILLGHVGYDWGKAAVECDRLADYNRLLCYTSLGTNAAGNTVLDTERSIALCNEGHPDWRRWCFVGVVKNFIDVSADPQDGIDFCHAMPPGDDQDGCFAAVGEQLTVLHFADTGRRGELCAAAGVGERACRTGARLPALTAPPAGP